MKKILVPTDLSDLSGYALTLAQKFASQSGAEILALTVVPTPADAVFTHDGGLAEDEDFNTSTLKKEMQKSGERLAGWIGQSGIAATPLVNAGTLTDQILQCIKQEAIDLVIMGTHGLNGLRELIADSATEQVVRQSSVPVLSLKCDRSDLEIKNIVLASKFDSIDPRQIRFIKELQQAFGATIHLLRVITPGDFKTTRYLQEHMKAFAAANGLGSVAYHIWADKDVEAGILHFTQDMGMDMISIGVEKDKIARLFQKHVSSALVNHVFYPILTFKI